MDDLIVVAVNLDSKRMASGIIGNDVPRKGLRVRISCYPLNMTGRSAVKVPRPVFLCSDPAPLARILTFDQTLVNRPHLYSESIMGSA